MDREQQRVIILVQLEELRSQQSAPREIERRLRLNGRAPFDLSAALPFVQSTQVHQTQTMRQGRIDNLCGLSIDDFESRSQRLVTAHDLAKASLQCVNIQLTGETNDSRDVVERIARLHLVQK